MCKNTPLNQQSYSAVGRAGQDLITRNMSTMTWGLELGRADRRRSTGLMPATACGVRRAGFVEGCSGRWTGSHASGTLLRCAGRGFQLRFPHPDFVPHLGTALWADAILHGRALRVVQ